MGKLYLIQRGHFKETNPNPDNYDSILGERDGRLVYPDYMGYAEFEFGAIGKSYRRIFSRYDQYKLHITDLKTVGDVPFCIYCNDSEYENILNEIKKYLADATNRHEIHRYRLKCHCDMESHFMENDVFSSYDSMKYDRRTNFWWCIDDTDTGDWIAFTGCGARQRSVLSCIEKDHECYIGCLEGNKNVRN